VSPLKVCFLLPGVTISGGIASVLTLARDLTARHGMEVTLALTRDDIPVWDERRLRGLEVIPFAEARRRGFDFAVASWWPTARRLDQMQAERHAYYVQSLEDRFYPGEDERRDMARATYSLPVSFITGARWMRDFLSELRPEADCFYVRWGIDKEVFAPLLSVEPRLDGRLRVLVEGRHGSWLKAIPASLEAVRRMRRPAHVTYVTRDRVELEPAPDEVVGPLYAEQMAERYAAADVVLKLSRVEGMFEPPLEGFHKGATCVVTPVTGHEEFVVHGSNGLVVDWDDPRGTTRALELLDRDRTLLHELRLNALETARRWPSWEQVGDEFAEALREIRRRPPARARDA
jgi:glycosyltransferase involved in cell wall biosynthesis